MGNKSSVPANERTEIPRQPPDIKFRVLIIGRANAGKTSILQRVCDTTDSPIVYRHTGDDRERVQLEPSMDRGEHSIHDELVFSNHDGYIFHDSCGFEAGSIEEVEIVQEFIRQKSGKRRLQDRLHAIWYCAPMDNQRPQLDLKYFKDICPDQNVPVIAVFTKFDQFLRNVEMHLEDHRHSDDSISDEAERQFREHYLSHLDDGARFVRLEKMHKPEMRCDALLDETVKALSEEVVALMLVAVQRKDLGLSINMAVKRVDRIGIDTKNTKHVIRTCLFAFPQIWFGEYWSFLLEDDEDEELFKMSFKSLFLEKLFLDDFKDKTARIISQIMSLSIVTKHTHTGNSIYHLRLAIIIILKHAAVSCLSGISAKSAVTQAESGFRKANIMLQIREHFPGAYKDYTVKQFIDFLRDTNIVTSESE